MLTHEQQPNAPIIVGVAGDIGRSALQQLILERGVVPAGVVLRDERLADRTARVRTATQIAENFHADGIRSVFNEVRLDENALNVDGAHIPVFTPSSQHEILQENHPAIDATGQHKTAKAFEPLLEDGGSFVLVTGPMKDDTETIVAGVNDTSDRLKKARAEGVVSTSSCTTTASSSFIGPILGSSLEPSAIFLNVLHARTKSNKNAELNNSIKLSPSGAITEIPKVLGIDQQELAFELDCSRADVSCGSLATMAMLLGPEQQEGNDDLKTRIMTAMRAGSSSYELDRMIDSTRSVIGRRASVILNLNQMRTRTLPGYGGTLVSGILGYYDNVGGYTRSALDSYVALDAA